MLLMGSGLAATDTTDVFEVTEVCDLIFSVEGTTFTGGTLQIQYSPNYSENTTPTWYDLDVTNLAFTTRGQKVATWGECHIRGSVTSWNVDAHKIWIGGRYVHPVE